jgi:NADH-quinone oxidoreductase subunit L
MSMTATLLALTIGLPWIGGLLAWWAGDRRPRLLLGLAGLFSAAGGLAAIGLVLNSGSNVAIRIPLGGVFGDLTFVADGLGVFLAAVADVVGCLAVIFSFDYMRGERQLGRYYSLVLFFIGAMSGLALTGSLLFLFFFWEITAFCSYALISFHNDDPKAVAGGVKALIITSLGGVGLLAASLAIHASTGSYEIDVFLTQAGSIAPTTLSIIGFGVLAAAAAKSAQVPFHTWLPDAMEAPTPISALIHAATMVNAGVYILARFFPAFALVPGWQTAVVIVGLASALLAGLLALAGSDIKRMLAYSTISQLGYMVCAIGFGGVLASQFHLLSHALFKALLFLGAGAVIHAVGTRDMRQMGGLRKEMPFVRGAFLIGALALAGLPIVNGFWSKEAILESGLEAGPLWGYLGLLLGAGLTALYTFRAYWMVFEGPPAGERQVHDAPGAMRFSLAILAVGCLTSWLLAGPFTRLLADTLPWHSLHPVSTLGFVLEVVLHPATALALLVVIVGLAGWRLRSRLAGVRAAFARAAGLTSSDFGFEPLNRAVVRATNGAARWLGQGQTGQLNWNVAGIAGGLTLVLAALLIWGS